MGLKLTGLYADTNSVKIEQLENKVNKNTNNITNATNTLNTIDNKVTNLSKITLKNNIANQSIPQQRINQVPTENEHIVRYYEYKKVQIVNHTTLLNANTVYEWTPTNYTLRTKSLNKFLVKLAVYGVDYLFYWGAIVNAISYRNMGNIFTFANGDNFNETMKCKIWIENGKIKMFFSQQVAKVEIFAYNVPDIFQ